MTNIDEVLANRDDLAKFEHNARLAFALEQRYQLDDVETEASNCLTDGEDDCKCDLIYIDRDSRTITVAQAYESQDPNKTNPPANKASDLNTAVNWLFSGRDIEELPTQIRQAAREIREALENGKVDTVEIWYVHNLNESKPIEDVLKTVEIAARDLLKTNFPSLRNISVLGIEVGKRTLQEWFARSTTPILVSDKFEVEISAGYEVSGNNWKAFVTAVRGDWLHSLYKNHGQNLFSANLRGYLGSRKKDDNINNSIKHTVSDMPDKFWVFNNGITALVNKFEVKSKNKVVVSGLSIVNGAQTTGSIGTLSVPPPAELLVPARFVECTAAETVASIIRFNNSQNIMKAADFRSNDSVQKRLQEEFGAIPDSSYSGGRRGVPGERTKKQGTLIPADAVAQCLACFQGDPEVAYNNKSDIWISDTLYPKYFNPKTSAAHIVFVYSLLRCIDEVKQELKGKHESGALSEKQQKAYEFLKKRGSLFMALSGIAGCMEEILQQPIPNKFRLSFGHQVSVETGMRYWKPVVTMCLPFFWQLGSGIENGLNNKQAVTVALNNFSSMLQSYLESSEIPAAKNFAAFVER